MRYFYKFLLKIMGWKIMDTPVPEPKCIILGVPHTSGWDFVISYLFYHSYGASAYIMVKKEFFWGPLGPILRFMGGIPVDKNKGATFTRQIIEEFNSRERLHLAIAPEGTRKATTKWKTGFHTIARAANIPVYLGFFDWGKKEIGRGVKFDITDDIQGDLKRIKQWYKNKGVQGKFPENFVMGNEME